jgi:hypothetical protein
MVVYGTMAQTKHKRLYISIRKKNNEERSQVMSDLRLETYDWQKQRTLF